MAARMSVGEHKQIEIVPGDTIVISARTIPGNERAVSHMIDNLYRRGAEVLSWDTADVHVSGHACEEELKLMLNVTRPRFFIPMHGTLRHLIHHARLAEAVGVPHGVVVTNGQVAEIDGQSLQVLANRVTHGGCCINAMQRILEDFARSDPKLREIGHPAEVTELLLNPARRENVRRSFHG